MIYSPAFAPMIGGIESVIETLALQFHEKGHEVCVLCQAADDGKRQFPFRVVRRPRFMETLRCWKWAEVVMHANVSLKGLLPFLLVRRPWAATHHGWYSLPERPPNFNAKLKRGLAKWFAAANIAVSQAVADYLGIPCTVIPNPYEDETFRLMPEVKCERELLFVGRLVSDKAPNLLLDAVGMLKERGLCPGVTFTGRGPEMEPLQNQAVRLGISDQVEFSGPLRREDLARCMNRHRILVVPSTILEGFGIVAVEGIACGCVVVGANVGGLPEAIGPCGVVFQQGDAKSLAETLEGFLMKKVSLEPFLAARSVHLDRHTRTVVSELYLSVLQGVTRANKANP